MWVLALPSPYPHLHVTSVSESSVSGLGGSLILSHLQTQVSLASPQLLLGELALVLVSHLGSQTGSIVLGVQLGLKVKQYPINIRNDNTSQRTTHQSRQSVQAQGDLSNVALLEQISSLEDLLLWHSVLLDASLEPLDVLHQLEVGSLLLDLLHGSGGNSVDQLAQDNAVLQHILVIADQLLAGHLADPVQDLLLLILVTGL